MRTNQVPVILAALFLVLAAALPVGAVQPDEVLADAGLEARARAISAELRCLVCQNQSIDDSDAELARDLRVLVRERLQQGDSDDDVMRFVVSRYGEFVLLKPRLSTRTLLLWGMPALLLASGVLLIAFGVTRRRAKAPAGLDARESARLNDILNRRD